MAPEPKQVLREALEPAERRLVRVVLRYCALMLLAGLTSGVFYRESTKHMDYAQVPAGLHLEATLPLALSHGHVLLLAVLLPLAFLCMLLLARLAGGAALKPASLRWLQWGYLPCATVAVLLFTLKGWAVFQAVQAGERDFDAIDARFFFGLSSLRFLVYGGAHIGLSVSAAAFLWGLWHSLDPEESA